MPLLSEAMEEGTILSWLIEDGSPVSVGDELVEIETDKAAMTYVAEADGILETVVPEGELVPVGKLIARLGEPGATRESDDAEVKALDESNEVQRPPEVAEPTVANTAPVANGSQVAATPLARRMAVSFGIALESVAGSGPRGRVTKADVLASAGVDSIATKAAPSPVPHSRPEGRPTVPAAGTPSSAKGAIQGEELTNLQRVVARRMSEAKATIPEFQVETEATMDSAVALRSDLKDFGGVVRRRCSTT